MPDARRVLVVEGNAPEALAHRAAFGVAPAAESYGRVLRALEPSIEIRTAAPSDPSFKLADAALDEIDAAVLTGSGVLWSADDDRAAPHRALFLALMDRRVPTAGSCWGAQIAAVALGGGVGWSPKGREVGVARSIRLTEAGAAHPVFRDKPDVFDSVCIHRDEITDLPSGAARLAGNDHSAVQAFAFARDGADFVGWQYHPELSLAEIADYLAASGGAFDDDGAAGGLFEDAEARRRTLEDFRAIAADPGGQAARRWRYGVTDHAADPALRQRELRNWLTMLMSRA